MIKANALSGIVIVLSVFFMTACTSVTEPDGSEQPAAVGETTAVEQAVSSDADPTAAPESVATEAAVSEETILVPTTEPAPEAQVETVDWTQTAGIDGDYYVLGNLAAPVRLVDFSDFM